MTGPRRPSLATIILIPLALGLVGNVASNTIEVYQFRHERLRDHLARR
jgi:hypothetical protein